jgi:hypothetical protein
MKSNRIICVALLGILLAVSITVCGGCVIGSNSGTTTTTTGHGQNGLVISSPDFNATTDPGGRSINNSGVILSSITLSNPNLAGTPSYENVVVNLVIHKAPGVETSDVVFEYQAGGSWHVITFNKVDPQTLSGTIGSGGVSVPSGYNVTTPLRATFKGAGKYQVQAQATN